MGAHGFRRAGNRHNLYRIKKKIPVFKTEFKVCGGAYSVLKYMYFLMVSRFLKELYACCQRRPKSTTLWT